jgi:hypothetical protein
MGDHIWGGLVTVASGIIGIAIIAVLVSKNAQTGSVITAAGQTLANDITAAVAPVSGASASVNTGSSGFGFGPIGSSNF